MDEEITKIEKEKKNDEILELDKGKLKGCKIAEPVEWAIPVEPRRSTSPERTAELLLDSSESSKRQDRYRRLIHLTLH